MEYKLNILKHDYDGLKDVRGWVSPRDCMGELFGGIPLLAEALGLSKSTVYGWVNGIIPHKHQYKILQLMTFQYSKYAKYYIEHELLYSQLIMGKIKK